LRGTVPEQEGLSGALRGRNAWMQLWLRAHGAGGVQGTGEDMGLDLYAGPLSRYHTGAWETVVQRYCRENGVTLNMVYAQTPPRLPRFLAPAIVRGWRHFLRRRFSLTGLKWPESEVGDYWTDKPGRECLNALLLAAAYAEHPEFIPPENPPDDCETDPAYRASSQNYLQSLIAVLECQMFLPSDENFLVAARDAAGMERAVTSTANLELALDRVNAAHWQAEETQFEKWSRRGPVAQGRLGNEDDETAPDEASMPPATPFTQNAQLGFALYREALKFSRTHNVPIVTDE
jgi:hypothetical protein